MNYYNSSYFSIYIIKKIYNIIIIIIISIVYIIYVLYIYILKKNNQKNVKFKRLFIYIYRRLKFGKLIIK